MTLELRDTQTQVKHKILERYLNAWSGIILNGLVRSKRPAHFVYVDCFAHKGRYAGNREDSFLDKTLGPVDGSPLIGVRALDNIMTRATGWGVPLTTNAVLVERSRKCYDILLKTLADAGLGERVRETRRFADLGPNEIAVVCADATSIKQDLLAYTSRPSTWAFYLLDPYGPSGIPHHFVRDVVRGKRHDVMINLIYADLHRKTGQGLKYEQLSDADKKHVDHWTEAFGSEEWISVVNYLRILHDSVDDGAGFTEETEKALTDLYYKTLGEMDGGVAIKSIRLKFPDKERPLFYLFLTTHDGTGALTLNKVLDEAELREYELRFIRRAAKAMQTPAHQPTLFETEVPQPPAMLRPDRPPTEEVAQDVFAQFRGQCVKRRDIYRGMAETMYFDTEIDSALRWLKRQEKAAYEDNRLRHETVIQFREE